MKNFVRRALRELRKNSLPDFVRKVSFYYFGKGRFLWALDKKDWEKKRTLAKKLFADYPVGNADSLHPAIVYVIPGTWIAGGIAVVLRHANMLKERGYDVVVVSQDLRTTVPWFAGQQVEIIPMSGAFMMMRI